MPCPHAGSIRRVWEAYAFDPGERLSGPQPWQWTLQARESLDMMVLTYRNEVLEEGPYGLAVPTRLILRPNKPGHTGTTSVLSPHWADLSMMRTWAKRCIKEHGQKCEYPDWMRLRPESIAMPEWLVDVVDYCVVEYNADTAPYIALSYTWGGVQCLKHTSENIEGLKEKGSLHPDKTSNIPRTVRDAFEITKLLGERYLWVDSLCIPQGEPTATKGLNSMHHIYANSIICLVAFAGTDADHGLRGIQGVSLSRHVEQVIYDLADGEKLSWIPRSCKSILDKQPDAIEGSRYSERGWTCQEYVFAKRRLIFTDGLLHWACQCANWNEETYGELDFEIPSSLDAESTFWMTCDTGPNLVLVENTARDFNTRYFTYGEDVLKGFLGIQNHISREFLGGFNYGHPQIFFDVSLLWRARTTRQFVSRRRLGGITSSDPPSWSWMGWQSVFCFYRDEEYMNGPASASGLGFTQSVAQWYTMRNSLVPVLDLQPVNCLWQTHRAAVKNTSAPVPLGWQKIPYDECDSEYCYRRGSSNEGSNNDNSCGSVSKVVPEFEPTEFKYPIPLPEYTEMCASIEQRPLLYTSTTRSFFVAKPRGPDELPSSRPLNSDFPFNLLCRDGESAGLLELHYASDEPYFKVEVVAVVKGWTTVLSHYFSVFQAREDSEWSIRDDDDSEDGFRPFMKHDCYFVLCVEWENGIAKRQGTGMVEASIWERNQEPVELILG